MPTSIVSMRRMQLFTGVFAMLCMGASYAWGVFVIPLEQQFGWLRTQTSLAFTLNVLCFSIGIIMTGILSSRCSYAMLMRCGALMMGAGFFASSLCTHIYQLYFSYSILCGMGAGLAYNSIVSSVPQWFPEKPALSTGCLLVGYAMSSALFGPLSNFLISSFGTEAAFRVIAAFSLSGILLASLFLSLPAEEQEQQLPHSVRRDRDMAKDIPTSAMVKNPSFWLTFFILAFVSGSGMLFINHISPMLSEEMNAPASVAAAVISVMFFFNASGRIMGGIFLDKKGVKITVLSITGIMFLALSSAFAGIYIKSSLLLIAGAVGALFAFGANANMIPSLVRELFGQKFFSLNYSIMNLNTIIVSAMPTLVSALQIHYQGYGVPLFCLVVLILFTFMLSVLLVQRYRH